MHLDDEKEAALRKQLAAAGKTCEYPGCTDQATGVRKVGKTFPYMCDPHLADDAGRGVVEQKILDAEHRTRYPNGLTLEEWAAHCGQS